MTDEPLNTDDLAELQQHVEERSVGLQLQLCGFLERHLGPDSARGRLIAIHAIAEVLGRLLLSEVQSNPAGLRSALLILDTLREAVVVPGAVRH